MSTFDRCLAKVFFSRINAREEWKIASYSAERQGTFAAHRDTINMKGSDQTHRQFAVSLLLNDDYSGGGLLFPEYSEQIVSAPKYSAVIFSGTLYHEVSCSYICLLRMVSEMMLVIYIFVLAFQS